MPNVRFRLNGVETDVDADPDRSLLDILRGQLGMTGPHFGCGAGECGACNVMIGDRAVAACDTPLWSVAGKDIMTPEGLGSVEEPHPLQRAFIAEQAGGKASDGFNRIMEIKPTELHQRVQLHPCRAAGVFS